VKYPKEFDYYGGAIALAEMLDVGPGRVRNWKRLGRVSSKYESHVREAVRRFNSPPPEPEPAPARAQARLSDIADLIADFLRERGL